MSALIVKNVSNVSTKRKRKAKKDQSLNESEALKLPRHFTSSDATHDASLHTCYVGLEQYEVSIDKRETTELCHYIESLLGSAYKYASEIKSTEHALQEYKCEIMLQIMANIASYNSRPFPMKIPYKIIDVDLKIPECVLFIDSVIVFNERFIDKILNAPEINVTVNYEGELKDEYSFIQMNASNVQVLDYEKSRYIFRLIVAADHAMAHLFEGSNPDYVNHGGEFAMKYYTIHSKLRIIPKKDTSLILAKFDDSIFI
jgi:hypothetical protein